ncbi:MAG: hypothetical protein LC114_21360 [Bryobacterales bacterium]|nr:hypothetical protein [Bryobacterales bacterium]
MTKILDPDTLAPKRPSASVQDYLARKYASLKVCSECDEPDPHPEGNEPGMSLEDRNTTHAVASREPGDSLPPPRPPVSEKKREANRRNAQRSTGPKTPAGKAASSANSRRHGLYSGTMLLSIEEDEDYTRILQGLRDFYQPANFEEGYVIEMVAQQRHRLLRHAALETGYLDYKQRRQWENEATLARIGRTDPVFEKVLPILADPQSTIPNEFVNLILGRCFDATLTNARSSLTELSRIENNHRRNLAYWESRLEQLLRNRKRPLEPPAPGVTPAKAQPGTKNRPGRARSVRA